MFDAGNGRPVIWGAAGRDQYIVGPHGLAGGEPERVRILEHRTGLDDMGAGFFDIGRIGRLQPCDLLILVGDQGRPVERCGGDGPTEAGGVLDFLVDVGGVD